MHQDNKDIAHILYECSDFLEASGSNPYRVRAYRRAADNLLNLQSNIKALIQRDFDLTSLPGIGKKMAYIIDEIAKTKKMPNLELSSNLPIASELQSVHGLV